MSEPRKHHYVPVCYLKQWANTPDRRLCEHKLIPGVGVKPRRTSPDGTGYQVDLYRVDGVQDALAQEGGCLAGRGPSIGVWSEGACVRAWPGTLRSRASAATMDFHNLRRVLGGLDIGRSRPGY